MEEALLAKASQMSTVPNEVFSKFNNADVKFGKVKRENGQEDELTNGNFATFMESHDRAVRKAAFEALYKQYGGVYQHNCGSVLWQCQAGNVLCRRKGLQVNTEHVS